MAKLKRQSISRRTVDALSVDKDTVFWDRELMGFGVRVYPSGAKYYIVQVRGPEGSKRLTVGPATAIITADQARAAGGADHRADQGGGGSGPDALAAGAGRPDGRRDRGALP